MEADMVRAPEVIRSKAQSDYRSIGLLRGLWWIFSHATVDRQSPHGLSSHLLRDIGLEGQSAGDGEEPWKRLK
jgi:hypothetical protein